MRNLIHELSFAVFAIALLFALAALIAGLIANGRWSMVGACAVVAVTAYTVGWLTEPEGTP